MSPSEAKSSETNGLDRFRFLATFVAGRPLEVVAAPAGEGPYTDGQFVYVTGTGSVSEQRRQMLVQAALLGAGSLDARLVKQLRGRPNVARRYLALEGHRVCAALAERIPLIRTAVLQGEPATTTADQSMQVAKGRQRVAEPPEWFGTIRPSRVLASPPAGATTAIADERKLKFNLTETPEAEDDDQEPGGESKILKLLENPLFNSETMADFFSKLFGGGRSSSSDTGGGTTSLRAVRRVNSVGPNARPLPVRLRITTAGKPGPALGVGGALYPEWDVHGGCYRPEHCRVLEFPIRTVPDVSAAHVQRDEVLRARLSRLGLGPQVKRRRPDGDDLDIEALIDLFIDLRAGHSPPENVYVERRKTARDLGVLILVDASGSATDVDSEGLSVHERQRRAATTIAVTLEELGDRVAVYGFRSQGRSAVHCLALKPFAQRFSAGARARLNQLEPDGYTRLGAGIRHAGEILKTQAGTPNRLLLVLSDGFPYDDGYESTYAEADAHRALEELRNEGVACLCLSIGTSTPTDALHRVFGAASHANAPTLAELSPRMDELFLSALKELSAPSRRGSQRNPRDLARSK